MKYLLPLLFLLCSCARPAGRQNPGAAFPYDIVTGPEMAAVKVQEMPYGAYLLGACLPDRIVERYAGSEEWVLPHEVAHLGDRLGSYRAAIVALTPPDPTPFMQAKLKVLREIDEDGPDYWATIYRRYGREALGGHRALLGRFSP